MFIHLRKSGEGTIGLDPTIVYFCTSDCIVRDMFVMQFQVTDTRSEPSRARLFQKYIIHRATMRSAPDEIRYGRIRHRSFSRSIDTGTRRTRWLIMQIRRHARSMRRTGREEEARRDCKKFIKYASLYIYIYRNISSSGGWRRRFRRRSIETCHTDRRRRSRDTSPRVDPSNPLYASLSRGDSAISMHRFNFVGFVHPGSLKFQSTIPGPLSELSFTPPALRVCVSRTLRLREIGERHPMSFVSPDVRDYEPKPRRDDVKL